MPISMVPRRPRALLAIPAAAAIAITTLLAPPAEAASTTVVRFAFDGAARPDGSTITTATNHGTAPVRVAVASADGGRVVSATTRSGTGGRAIRLPTFDPAAPAPRAVLRITNSGSGDRLNPGTAAVQFGADFTLDSTSARAGSAIDDGNNLIQRGLWNDRTQLKLEVDNGRPICRVKGRSGEVSITASTAVQVNRWYRLSCRRSGNRVTLTLGSWSSSGTYSARSWSKDGTTGSLTPSSPSIPLSVGGKLNANGTVSSATDQFNGRIDNVVMTIG